MDTRSDRFMSEPFERVRLVDRSVSASHRPADLETAAQVLLDARRIAVMTHVRTDGDGLSAWALASALKKLAKQVQVFADAPSELSWMRPDDPDLVDAGRLDPDAAIVTLDCANYARNAWPSPEREEVLALLREFGGEGNVPLARYDAVRPVTLVIDHHITNRAYGLWNWIEPDRAAVAEMVLELILVLQELSGRDDLVDSAIARWLMAGIVTSTDWFRHHTDARIWRAAAWLEQTGGVDQKAKAELAFNLTAVSPGYFRLSGALRHLTRIRAGVASVRVSRSLLERYGVTDDEAARFIDDMTALPAQMYVLLVELADGSIRARLRGRERRVDTIAQAFGGGGHEYASGTILPNRTTARRLVRAAEASTNGEGLPRVR